MADDATSLGKIANLLGLLLTKDMNGTEKIGTLIACGFSAREIAVLIGTSENTVYARLSDFRKKSGDKNTAKKASPKIDG